MYGDLLRYHLSVALIIMLLLLMMQPGKPGFIVFEINLMYLILSRNGKLWLKMRQEKGSSVSDQKMEMNIAVKSLIYIVHRMEFVE